MNEICGNPACEAICQKQLVCSRCKATPYCSKNCQKAHWKIHKKLCNWLNKGKEQQLHHPDHNEYPPPSENFIVGMLVELPESCRKVHSYFKSTKENDPPQKVNKILEAMKKIIHAMPADDQLVLLHHTCCLLLHAEPWQIDLPTSPLKLLLQAGADPNVIPKKGIYNFLTLLAAQHAKKESFKKNQVAIARQLIEGGADVNRPAQKDGAGLITALYFACRSHHYTNIDFIQLLLENGANPNQQTVDGYTPLMASVQFAAGAAIFVLKFEHVNKVEVDPNVRNKWGESLWSLLYQSIYNNMRQREIVRRTGQAANSDSGWDKTDQYDEHIARLKEVKSLIEACGAEKLYPRYNMFSNASPRLCTITLWQEHMLKLINREFPRENRSRIKCHVSDLFKIDIVRDKNAPAWSKPENKSFLFINDAKAQVFEAHEGKEYLHSAGGRKPAVGMGLLLHCGYAGLFSGGCSLVGEIVEVSKPRSDEYLRRSLKTSNPSTLYGNPCPCNRPECQRTLTGKRHDILKKFGAVHGDEVKGVVKLRKDHEVNPEFVAFFGAKKKFDVVLRCDDRSMNMWEVVRIDPHASSSG